MDSDRHRWDERYAGAAPASPAAPEALALAGAPTDPRRRGGRALDLACGAGAVTLWLAAGGMDVLAVDVSPAAIALLDGAARSSGLSHHVDARVADLDRGLPDPGPFDIIVCQRFRDPQLYPAIAVALGPGGHGCVTVLSAVGRSDPPGRFHARPGELLDAFDDPQLEVLAHTEHDGIASIVIHRPGPSPHR